jgi:hypothetical protein
VKVSGAGLTDLESIDLETLAPEPFLRVGGKSPLAWRRPASFFFNF